MNVSKDLVAASATPLVLAILAEADSYGYAILKRVSELSGGQLQWADGMLYPMLHRLDRLGYVEASWRISENGRRPQILSHNQRRTCTLGDPTPAMANRGCYAARHLVEDVACRDSSIGSAKTGEAEKQYA